MSLLGQLLCFAFFLFSMYIHQMMISHCAIRIDLGKILVLANLFLIWAQIGQFTVSLETIFRLPFPPFFFLVYCSKTLMPAVFFCSLMGGVRRTTIFLYSDQPLRQTFGVTFGVLPRQIYRSWVTVQKKPHIESPFPVSLPHITAALHAITNLVQNAALEVILFYT